uniref:Major histocompatibility complex class I-related gene protein-like n=1 Tax=Astyanax mexicanus TaxID=7994 RepID=A0A3B1JY43_ASTMX
MRAGVWRFPPTALHWTPRIAVFLLQLEKRWISHIFGEACARLYPPNVGGISLNKNIYFNKLVLIFVFERKTFSVKIRQFMLMVFIFAATHYLQFLLTGVTPGTSFPEFSAVGQLDGEQGGYYDSTIRTVILKADWVKKSKDTEHWKMMTQRIFEDQQLVMERLGNIMKHFNQTEGVHTVQWVYRCELDDDGSKRGYMQCGYDGEDFLSLDLNSLSWIAPVPQALITKHKWEETGHVLFQKHFLLNECIGWLQKYVEYGRSTLERKVPPEVSLFQKDSSFPVVCHATGFFPKAVMISWQKNGEELNEDVELRETVPNQDGTFQKRSILTLSPEELKNNKYTCVVQHEGFKKKLQVSDRRVLSVKHDNEYELLWNIPPQLSPSIPKYSTYNEIGT